VQKNSAANIDRYVKGFPPAVREKLTAIRSLVKHLAPDATEAIKYGIPTFVLNGNLVHFSAFKDHIGFFPTSSGVAAFKKELVSYDTAKGTIRFPLDQPLPLALIKKIVKFRIKENQAKGT
jgi:uncharacterized protein YdhG (YjbR/CyaY superfamily)